MAFIRQRTGKQWLVLGILSGLILLVGYLGMFLATMNREDFNYTKDFFGLQYKGNTGNYIDKHIYYFDAYEKPILFFMRDAMRGLDAEKGVFLDVGANTGQHSLFMSLHASEVHAFEPYAPVLVRFREHLKLNNLSNVVIYPVGLGDKKVEMPFYDPPDSNQGTGSFVEGSFSENALESHLLKIVVGDDELERNGVEKIDLIKMDIEGYEKYALIGLKRTMEKSRPIIVMELTLGLNEDSFNDEQELRSVFPKDYVFLSFGIIADSAITGKYCLEEKSFEDDGFERWNVLAYPREKEASLPLPRCE